MDTQEQGVGLVEGIVGVGQGLDGGMRATLVEGVDDGWRGELGQPAMSVEWFFLVALAQQKREHQEQAAVFPFHGAPWIGFETLGMAWSVRHGASEKVSEVRNFFLHTVSSRDDVGQDLDER